MRKTLLAVALAAVALLAPAAASAVAHDPILFVHGWCGERIALVDDDQKLRKRRLDEEKSSNNWRYNTRQSNVTNGERSQGEGRRNPQKNGRDEDRHHHPLDGRAQHALLPEEPRRDRKGRRLRLARRPEPRHHDRGTLLRRIVQRDADRLEFLRRAERRRRDARHRRLRHLVVGVRRNHQPGRIGAADRRDEQRRRLRRPHRADVERAPSSRACANSSDSSRAGDGRPGPGALGGARPAPSGRSRAVPAAQASRTTRTPRPGTIVTPVARIGSGRRAASRSGAAREHAQDRRHLELREARADAAAHAAAERQPRVGGHPPPRPRKRSGRKRARLAGRRPRGGG